MPFNELQPAQQTMLCLNRHSSPLLQLKDSIQFGHFVKFKLILFLLRSQNPVQSRQICPFYFREIRSQPAKHVIYKVTNVVCMKNKSKIESDANEVIDFFPQLQLFKLSSCCEQSLFSSKILGEERKTSKNASVTGFFYSQ